jgi:GxxExxY protein
LGPGLAERIYVNALKIELTNLVLQYVTEKEFTVKYQNHNVGKFRVDLLVEDKIGFRIAVIDSEESP